MEQIKCPNCEGFRNKILPPKTVLGVIGFMLFAFGLVLFVFGIFFFPLWIIAIPAVFLGALLGHLPQQLGFAPMYLQCKACGLKFVHLKKI